MKSFFLRIYRSKPFHCYKTAWFLLGVCFLFVLLRLPSLVEPHWYGDEGIYQVVAHALNSGKTLYRDIWDNKPPLLYLIYATFDGNLFFVKLLSLLSGVFSIIAFFFLSRKILKQTPVCYFSTTIYAILFGLPVIEGNIANAENFMLLPIILASYFVISYTESKKNFLLIIAGVLLSIGLVTKIVAVFDFAAFLTFLYFAEWIKWKKNFAKPITYFTISFLSALLFCVSYFLSVGLFRDFFSAVFSQNVSYVGDQNKFILPMGILIFKSIVLCVLLGGLFLKRNGFSKSTLFIYVWIIFALYNAFFSERPYIHYLLVLLPAFCLLIGHLIENLKTRIIDCAAVLIIILFALFHFQIYFGTISYYGNFFSFITNRISVVVYEKFFDINTPRDYDIANFISINTTDSQKVFLWSDSAQIYALSKKLPIGKYIVAYHITFYKNADVITKQQIEKIQPKYIIRTIEEPFPRDILSSYQLRYIMEGVKIYEREI